MPEADHTPDLELASSSVRAKISVTDPRLPSGQKIVIAFSNWSTDDLTELPLEAAPDEDVTDADGNVVIDPEDGQPLKRYNVYANTPLAPVAPAKADGLVTCSYPGMTPCDKRVVYGDQPMGHFTMSGGEAPEVAAP